MRQFLKRKLVLFNEQGLRSLRAVDIFDELMRFLHHFIAFVGADIFVEHFRWTFQTYVSFFSLVLFAVNLIYTVTVHWGEWYAVMDTLSISGIGFQGMIKMWSGLSNVEFFRKKRADLRSMHARNGRHPENNYVLLKNVLVILYIFRFFSVSYSVAGLFLFVIPGYMLMVRNEEVLLFALEIPTVDPLTHTGYVVTMGYQVFMVFLAIAGILAADMGIMIIVLHIVGIVDVFRNTMNELDQLLEDPDCEDDEIHEKVTEICMMHKEIIGYEEELNEHYFFTVFLLEFCALGTSLTLKNDHIVDAIYNTKWYLLCPSDQKKLQFMLHRSQNAVEMTIRGLALLNMETFVEIIKTIYSYFMMLRSFLE
ncbi:hypothetical protein quinque_011700 [Culex quinquefasciatus]